jgi:hypothetical protein
MSRAFEILERAQQDRDLFRVPPMTKAPLPNSAADGGESPVANLASSTREEILRLVQRLFLAGDIAGDTGLRQIVFCGIDEAEGSNLLCARVARVLAEQVQSPVCVVDANIHASSSRPLLDLLPFDNSPQSVLEIPTTAARRLTGNLWLASSDSISTNGVSLCLDDLRTWIACHGSEFVHMVISAPPLGLHTDAALLGQSADGVVLVLEANSTRWQTARRAKQALEDANVRVLGTVLNNRTFPIPEKIYRWL